MINYNKCQVLFSWCVNICYIGNEKQEQNIDLFIKLIWYPLSKRVYKTLSSLFFNLEKGDNNVLYKFFGNLTTFMSLFTWFVKLSSC